MYQEKYGKGEPVFLHGCTAFIESYMFQISFLAKNYMVIVVDRRAHGINKLVLIGTSTQYERLHVEKIKNLLLTEPQYTGKAISSIKSPTLVITGKNEELVKQEHTKHIAQRIPNAKLELLLNTDHFCRIEDPKKVNRRISDFLG